MKKELTKTNKKGFIFQTILISIVVLIFSIMLIALLLSKPYPSKNELKIENCTFVKYEDKKYVSAKHSSHKYLIYVTEYDQPLEIDNIVYRAVNKSTLDRLIKGDKLTLSIRNYNEHLDLYCVSCGNNVILSYETFLDSHHRNRTIGLIVIPIMTSISSGLLVWSIIHYKKKNELILMKK